MKLLTVIPAYGREYSKERHAIADWRRGRDFQIAAGAWCGCYVNEPQRENLLRDGYTHVNIRFNQRRDFALIDLAEESADV